MMAFVGYRIDQFGEGCPVAAGGDYDTVFMKTFRRIAPEISVFGSPDMAVRKVDITAEEAAELEALCAKHLDEMEQV